MSYIKKTYNDFVTGNEIEFNCKTDLRAIDIQNFATTVSRLIVKEDEYYSALRDVTFDFVLVSEFTDIDVAEITNSDNAFENIETFLSSNNAVDVIKNAIGAETVNKLSNAVDDGIAYKTGIIKHGILEEVRRFMEQINKYVSNIDVDEYRNFIQKMGGMDSEITSNEVMDYIAKSPSLLETLSSSK